jgi:hypothetical protein
LFGCSSDSRKPSAQAPSSNGSIPIPTISGHATGLGQKTSLQIDSGTIVGVSNANDLPQGAKSCQDLAAVGNSQNSTNGSHRLAFRLASAETKDGSPVQILVDVASYKGPSEYAIAPQVQVDSRNLSTGDGVLVIDSEGGGTLSIEDVVVSGTATTVQVDFICEMRNPAAALS